MSLTLNAQRAPRTDCATWCMDNGGADPVERVTSVADVHLGDGGGHGVNERPRDALYISAMFLLLTSHPAASRFAVRWSDV